MPDVAIIQRFLPSRSRGGGGYFTHGLASTLVRRGHRVTVFSQDPAPAGAAYAVSIVPTAGRLAPLAFPFALRQCDFRRFDVLHAQGDEQFIRRRDHPPVVRTMHGTALAEAWFNGVRGGSPKRLALHTYFYLLECLAVLRADAVVTVSRHAGRFYPGAQTVIPNGIDLAALSPDGSPKSARPSILFIGEVDSRKRGRLLVDTYLRDVRTAIADAELWLVSPDRVEGPGITWHGVVDDAALARLLRQAWIMCLPSAYEGFGRPYAEALAAGTTVVASPNPGARDVLEDGKDGVLARDDDLAAALIRVLSNPAERAGLERRGLERAKAFGWDTVAAAYERVYDAVIEQARHRQS